MNQSSRIESNNNNNGPILVATSTATTTTTPITATRRMVTNIPSPPLPSNKNDSIPSPSSTTTYSTTDLTYKLTGDVVVATGVTFIIAPIMSTIDKAIVQKAAGTHSMTQSCVESVRNMVRHPISFVRSPTFLMMWGVYASTYCTANCLKTLYEHYQTNQPITTTTTTTSAKPNQHKTNESIQQNNYNQNINNPLLSAKMGIFLGTTTVNSLTTLLKDKYYAIHFGTSSTRSVPFKTFGLWALRDCMVIGSSFILPEIVSASLEEHTDMEGKTALQVSQFVCPVATQLVAGPIQLLGLDMYNRPFTNMPIQKAIHKRLQFQYTNFCSIVTARVSRIAPAYGIGGIYNTHFRDMWRERLLDRQERQLQHLKIGGGARVAV